MDSSDPIQLDILTIYKRFCELKYGNIYACGENVQRQDDDVQNVRYSREALAQLLKLVESKMPSRNEILVELPKLMQRLNLMQADFSEFSRFYDFVFFICRENGQKNITVSKAITAWRLVLAGRFRLLNQWCDFVERNQRYNISEDTWQQVLAFSRCVHETLEGYDPEGAWPVLIDDFVEHMYRISGSTNRTNFCCTCDDSESYEDSLPGLKGLPGLKRKFLDDGAEPVDVPIPDATDKHFSLFPKRWCQNTSECTEDHDLPKIASDDLMDMARHSSPRCSKPPCAVEGSLSKGFAGLFSRRSYMI